MTADDAVTRITNARDAGDAVAIVRAMPTRLLREVADLTYAVDYPDTATRGQLIPAIVEATR